MRRSLAAIAAAGALALGASACGSSQSGPCVVLAEGGNELCGAPAAAWCRATDPIRALDPSSPIVASAVALCQTIEGDYPQ